MTDFRNPAFVEHPLADLVRQRVVGLAAGYEDLSLLEIPSSTRPAASIMGS